MQHKRGRNPRFWILILFVTVGIFLAQYRQTDHVISPISDDFDPTTTPGAHQSILGIFSKGKNADALEDAVKVAAEKKWDNYSILVTDLRSSFQMGINETSIYDAASVNKIPILVALYHAASIGTVDMSKTITMQAQDVQDYGTGSMRYDSPGTVYSIRTMARLMVQKSDNTAAYIIANHIVGLDTIQSYIRELGTKQTDMEKNETSNKDIGLLFTKIFSGEIANESLTQEMIGLLKDTDFEDRLPAKLPSEAVVYHKIGTGIGAVHDTGVVESPTAKYYIGIFTSDVTDEELASEEVAQISRLVYDFMQ